MAKKAAGYTGVVYTDVDAGYTSAEGYTGVVHTKGASGYTGAAPVTARGKSSGTARAMPGIPPGIDINSFTRSPYDSSVVERGQEPGSTASEPDAYRTLPPEVNDGEPPEPENQAASPSTQPPDSPEARDDAQATTLDSFVRSLFDVRDQLRLSPQPVPNRALEQARNLLQNGLPVSPLPAHPVQLLGPLADLLNKQVADAIAQTKPNTLGDAYLQGIAQGLFEGGLGAGVGLVQMGADPIGTSIRTATELLQAIREHMADGEPWWMAVHSVLNPADRLFTEAWQANQIAGEAAEAYRRGDWQEAVRRAREAGQSAARAGIAASETVMLGKDLGGAGMRLRNRLRTRQRGSSPTVPPAPRPEDPPPPPRPPDSPEGTVRVHSEADPSAPPREPSPRPDRLTGTIVHDGVMGPQVPVRQIAKPHLKFSQLPVFEPEYIQQVRPLHERLLRFEQAEAASKLESMTESMRRDPKQRRAVSKKILNQREWLTAMDQQLAYPDRAYLTQVELVSVVTEAGEIPASKFGKSIDPKNPGRISDVLEVRPDGKFGDIETKTERAILSAYPKRGVEVSAFNRGTKLSKQIRKAKAVFDGAKELNGKVRVRGFDLSGRPHVIDLDPADFTSTRPSRYGELPN